MRKLTKHKDSTVVSLSEKIIEKWKKLVKKGTAVAEKAKIEKEKEIVPNNNQKNKVVTAGSNSSANSSNIQNTKCKINSE